jgi:hypothetical protein
MVARVPGGVFADRPAADDDDVVGISHVSSDHVPIHPP